MHNTDLIPAAHEAQLSSWRPGPSSSRAVLHVLVAVAPLLVFGWVHALAWRAAVVLGRWPRPYDDDPKFFLPADHWFDLLAFPTPLLVLWMLLSVVLFPTLMLRFRQRYSQRFILFLGVLYCAGWLALWFAPGTALDWYFD
ncbi:MAG: hypothetical protein M3R24_37705 [Chloroflexota bacterium]|nr:hypothetical protein [Chloroflexota bacterium]